MPAVTKLQLVQGASLVRRITRAPMYARVQLASTARLLLKLAQLAQQNALLVLRTLASALLALTILKKIQLRVFAAVHNPKCLLL